MNAILFLLLSGLFLSIKRRSTLSQQIPNDKRENIIQTLNSLTLSSNSKNTGDLDEVLTETLQGLLEGPLVGKKTVFSLGAGVENKVSLDMLLASIGVPVFLPRPKEGGDNGETTCCPDYESYLSNSTDAFAYDDLELDVIIKRTEDNQYSSGSVLISIKTQASKPVPIPATASSISGLLLICLEQCNLETLKEEPFALQTSAVAILCLTEKKTITRTESQRIHFRVYTWYPFHRDQKLVPLGLWSLTEFPKWEDLFIDRFQSLYSSTLHVSSDDSDMPFFFRHPDDTFDGTSKRIMEAIGSWIDFDFTLTRLASDDKWGELVNGTWVGMLGDVYRGDKDLAINYFSVTQERAQDFDFSVSHYNEGFGFTIMVPPPLPRWRSLTYPFTMLVWSGVFAALVIMAFVFHFFPHDQTKRSPTETILLIAMSLMNQSVRHQPSSLSSRVFLSIWWLAAYIIVISYTCNLIAVLTVPVYPIRIQNMEQLAKSDYRVCMLDYGEFVPEALATSKDPHFYVLGSKLDLVPTTEEGYFGEEGCVELVLQGSHSHVETFSYMQLIYIEMGYVDDVYFVKEQIYKANLAFFFRKNTPWKYKFDLGILRLVESGLVQKWYNDIMDDIRRKAKKGNVESSDQALSVAHLQGPFFILLFGFLLASIIFFFEHLPKR